MSRIPKLSFRPNKDLPITDDEKSTALPLSRRIANLRLGRDVANNQENGSQDRGAVKRREERNPAKKESKKATVPHAAHPSTSKRSASGAAVHRQHQFLNRSKTESSIKLGHDFNQRNLKTSTPLVKQTASIKPDVRVPKVSSKEASALRPRMSFRDKVPSKEAPALRPRMSFRDKVHSKEAPALKPRMSFRDKVPAKFECNNGDRPSTSKAKAKAGEEKIGSLQLRTRRVEAAPKFTTGKLTNNPNSRMNRSKTESCINTANLNKDRRNAKKAPIVQNEQQIHRTGKQKKETFAEQNVEPVENQEGVLSKVQEAVKKELDVPVAFKSPKECPFGGLRFTSIQRKRSLSLNFNIDPEGPNEVLDLPVEQANEE